MKGVADICELEEVGFARVLGTVYLNGVVFHADCVRVRFDGDGMQVVDLGDEYTRTEGDAFDALDSIFEHDPEGAFQTVKLEGFDGEWVVVLTPAK